MKQHIDELEEQLRQLQNKESWMVPNDMEKANTIFEDHIQHQGLSLDQALKKKMLPTERRRMADRLWQEVSKGKDPPSTNHPILPVRS